MTLAERRSVSGSRVLPFLLTTLFLLAGAAGVSTASASSEPGSAVTPAQGATTACDNTAYTQLSSYDNVITKYNEIVNNPMYKGYVSMWSLNAKYGHGPIPGVSGTYKDIYAIRLTNESRGLHKPEVLFAGPPHGDENIGVQVNVYFAHWLLKYALDPQCKDQALEGTTEWLNWLLDNREIYLTSSGNPYGYNSQRGDYKGRDLNREYDHTQCNVDSQGSQTGCGPTAIGLLRSVNGANIAKFMQGHQIRTASDWHGGTFALMYSFGYEHQSVTASSRVQSGRSVSYAPADFHWLDNAALTRVAPFVGPNPNGATWTPSKIGTWYSQMGYNSGGIYMDAWYASDQSASPKETWVHCPGPTCNSSPTGLMKGSDCDPNGSQTCKFDLGAVAGTTGWTGAGVMWYTPELGAKLVQTGWGGDRTAGWAALYRRHILLMTDLAEPNVRWMPGTPANNSQVPANTPIDFKWVVNGSMVTDSTQLFWAKTPDVMNDPAKKSAADHIDFAGKDVGGTGWESPTAGKTNPYVWKDPVTFTENGDWYVVARAKVDQVYGKSCTGTDPCGVIRPDVYGSDSYLKLIKQRTKPGWSQTIQGEDGPETMAYQEYWYSKPIHVTVGKDNVPPTVISTDPAGGAQNVAPNARVHVTFSEPMDKASAEAAFSLAPPASATFTWDAAGSTITATPSAPLQLSTQYSGTVGTGAKDLAANAMVAPKTWTFTTGSAVDVSPPFVVSTTPADGAISVNPSAPIVVVFNESMDGPSSESAFSLSPTAPGSFTWPSADRFQFRPTAALSPRTQYTIGLANSASDLAGNVMTAAFSARFTTGDAPTDTTPPSILATSPIDQAAGIALNKRIRITWSEPVQAATAEAAFAIAPAAPGTFSWAGDVMTMSPAANLAPSTAYTVTSAAGTQDLAGNAMTSQHTFSFVTGTTADTTPPTIVKVSPLDNAKGVPPATEIVFLFSEKIDATMIERDELAQRYIGFDIDPAPLQGKGTGNVEHLEEGRVVKFLPLPITIGEPGLAEVTTYNVKVKAGLEDLAGNPMAGDYDFSFTTGYNSPLLIVPVSPLNGANEVREDAKIVVEFNKPMDRTATEAAFSASPSIDPTFTWSQDDAWLEVSAKGGLKPATKYTVRVGAAAKSSIAQPADGDVEWSFTTRGYEPGGGGPPVESPGIVGLLSSPLWLVMLGLVVVTAIVAVGLIARRRKRKMRVAASAQFAGTPGPEYWR